MIGAIGAGLAAYTALLGVETVGLSYDKRWAEYLTFIETSVLLPYEIYDLSPRILTLKLIGLVLNLAILSCLASAHRLFGVRGGLLALAPRKANPTAATPSIRRPGKDTTVR